MSNTTDESYIWPEAHVAIGMSAISRAFWLDQASQAIAYEAIHGAPPSLTPEQKQQRTAVLKIAERILLQARDRAMDDATAHWRTAKAWS